MIADVCAVVMAVGFAVTLTELIATGTVTVTLAWPDLVESSVEVAVMVEVPAVVGVKAPTLVTVPPVAVQVTPWL